MATYEAALNFIKECSRKSPTVSIPTEERYAEEITNQDNLYQRLAWALRYDVIPTEEQLMRVLKDPNWHVRFAWATHPNIYPPKKFVDAALFDDAPAVRIAWLRRLESRPNLFQSIRLLLSRDKEVRDEFLLMWKRCGEETW
jgi:hypothetical protein